MSKIQAVQKDRYVSAVDEFIKRLTEDQRKQFLSEVDMLIVGSAPQVKYNVPESKSHFRSLIVMGAVDDLTDSALVGLVAHLYALYSIGYDRNPMPTGKKWLAVDLYSDDVARSWGFEREVDDLRELRLQKLPLAVTYPDIVIEYSALSMNFAKDISDAMKEADLKTENKTPDYRIWYVDKFSMICSLQQLRNDRVHWLHIITNMFLSKQRHERWATIRT